jgi:membrane protease YdiL (CAAX protease family)
MMMFFMHVHGETARATWFGTSNGVREALIGLATVPLVFVGVGILLNTLRLFAPALHNVENNPLERLAATPGQAAAFSLVAIVAGGLREELQRAFMLRRFEQYLGGATVGLWVLSVAFGLGHVMQGWDAVVTTATLGGFWGWMYLQRRSSIAPIASHSGFNSLEILRVAVLGQ